MRTRNPRNQATGRLTAENETREEWRTGRRERQPRSPCVLRQPCPPRRPIWCRALRSVVKEQESSTEREREKRSPERDRGGDDRGEGASVAPIAHHERD